MPPIKPPEDAARRLAAARADYVPDARKPTTRDLHTGRAGVVRELFDEIAALRAQHYLWRHIVDVLHRAQLAEPGLTGKQLSVAFNHEGRRRQGMLRRNGKLVASTVRPSPQPQHLALGAAETGEGTIWETALVDETGRVLQRHLINPDGDYLAYLAAQAAGIAADDLAQAEPGPVAAQALADAVARLALTAPVRLITNATRWTTVEFAEALSRRCAGPLRAFGAGIEISVVDRAPSTEIQSAVSVARQLRAGLDKA